MGFVKADLKKQIWPAFQGKESLFKADVLAVLYETKQEALDAIIPPGLKLRGKPLVEIALNDFKHTNFDIPYKEAALVIAVTDEKSGIDGKLVIAMTLNTDQGSFLGREANGYPKKVGHVGSAYDGEVFTSYCARHGVCYASYSCDTKEQPNDPEYEALNAEFNKFLPFKPGYLAAFNYIWPVGLRSRVKPLLQPMWMTMEPTESIKIGKADVQLNWSRHDPWASLPVVKVLGGSVVTGTITLMSAEDRYYTEVDSEAYLPYSFFGWDEPHSK
jgi:Acetoacetate decarboxylase (ADC).